MQINAIQLQTRNLTLRVGKRTLVHELNWLVHAKECWCIIGRNGAGKSTLLRNLAGLLPLSDGGGEITINDLALEYWPLIELAKLRAYLPQGRNDAFAYRVIETVLAARHPYHDGNYWESEHDVQLALAALAELDVADLAERDVRSLSGGERQRVALAALLAQDAQCLLLDEPTTSLDLSHQISTMELIASRCRENHKAAVMVTHDLNLAWRYASHALLMMPDGSWHAGLVNQTLTAPLLSQCLEHPVDLVWHGEQCLFVPR